MATKQHVKTVEDVVDAFPKSALPRDQRQKLKRLAKHLDSSLARDRRTGKPVVKKDGLISLAKDHELLGSRFGKAFEHKLKDSDEFKGLQPGPLVAWFEVAGDVDGVDPQLEFVERVRKAKSEQDLRKLLRDSLPDVDEHTWAEATKRLRDTAESDDPFGMRTDSSEIGGAPSKSLVEACLESLFFGVWWLWLCAIIMGSLVLGPGGWVVCVAVAGFALVGVLVCLTLD